MASFCSNCGAAASGRFCAACGAAIQDGPPKAAHTAGPVAPVRTAPVSAPGPSNAATNAPARAGGSSSATKILLLVAGVLMLIASIVVGGVVYVGYRAKQKIAELTHEYGVSGETASSSTNAESFPPSKGSGCPMLEGQEAAGILGAAVERVEFIANGPDDSEWCRYWVNQAERQRLERAEIASGINAAGNADTKSSMEVLEKVVGGALGAVIETAGENNNEDFAFSLQVWRSGGQAMWDKMEAAKADVKNTTGVDFAGLATQQVEGVGDRAMVLPGGHSIMVLKADKFFLIGFQQFVPGRQKTIALARAVAGRV